MTRLGLTLNRTKTRLCDARSERFDFLGYSFGPHCFRPKGRWYLGASPSKKSVQRLKDRVGDILVPGNMGRWEEVRDTLNRLLRGWCCYFSPGTHYAVDRAIEAHVSDCVRHFLARRHKMPARSIGPFSRTAVFGHLGVPRLSACPATRRPVLSLPRNQSESRMREIRTSGLMSGEGNRSDAAWPKPPRPSSTLQGRLGSESVGVDFRRAALTQAAARRSTVANSKALAGQSILNSGADSDRCRRPRNN
ncbi:MAG: group II intron maturase-specific domain-containing protein [Rhodospirillales bacterium]